MSETLKPAEAANLGWKDLVHDFFWGGPCFQGAHEMMTLSWWALPQDPWTLVHVS